MQTLFHRNRWEIPSGLGILDRIRAILTGRRLRETPFLLARVCASCGALRQAEAPWLDECRQVCPCCGETGTRTESVMIRGKLDFLAGKFRLLFYSPKASPGALLPVLPEGPGVLALEGAEDARKQGGFGNER